MTRRALVLVLVVLILMPSLAMAQQEPEHGYRYHNYRGDKDLRNVLDALGLTDEQSQQVIPMLSAYFQAKKTANSTYLSAVEALLTTEQKPQYELLRQQKARRKEMLTELNLSADQLQQEKAAHQQNEDSVRAARETLLSQVKGVLNAEQYDKLVPLVGGKKPVG